MSSKDAKEEPPGGGGRRVDLMELVRNGWRPSSLFWYKDRQRWVISLIGEKGKRTVALPKDTSDEEARRIFEEAKAEWAKLYGVDGKKSGVDEVSDLTLWWTKVMDNQPLIKGIVEKVSWMQDVIYDIGFASLMLALQFAKVPPENVYQLLERFNDKDAFEKFVLRNLGALLEASRDAARIVELEDENRALAAQLEFAKWLLEKVKAERDSLLADFRMAIASMDEVSLRRWTNSKIMTSIALVPTNGGEGERT